MAKKIELSPEALNNISEILQNVSEYTGSISSATKLFGELSEKFEYIGFLPKSGKIRADGIRETFCRGY
ncbi:type II toxin-antitoxin system RelE/ParE family toxin [Testudinibacter sp. TR-2022]|uniref:type II toxin-antitoxin system RelE/ParE family toxin n=1 Tax=Testudinibacter sp. TR-2022 TaxID=2585029 RepID=UPI002278B3F2|nr:type II toxin-antitoxin system RelE/ParE family toxin [Testudinibacter sp. TR-2022]